MTKRADWTPEEREFDRILTLMESRNQLHRISGRCDWVEFQRRFTKEQLDAMAERIGAKKR